MKILSYLSLLLLPCCSNVTLYRAHLGEENLVIAGGDKPNWLSSKQTDPLPSLWLHNYDDRLLREYPELVVGRHPTAMIRIGAIEKGDLEGFNLNTSHTRYIPPKYPENSQQFDYEGISLILDSNSLKFLGARLLGSEEKPVYFGTNEETRKIPIMIGDLKKAFGEGIVFNTFYH